MHKEEVVTNPTPTQQETLEGCPFCPAELTPLPSAHLPADLHEQASEWYQITHNAGCYLLLLGFGDYPIHRDRLKAWNTRRAVAGPRGEEFTTEVIGESLQKRLFDECVTANWDPEHKNTFAEEIAHLHEELSEAFRAFRRYKDFAIREVNGKLEGVPIEFADALIGMFYNAELYGFDLLGAIERKHQFNLGRNYVAEGRQLHPPAAAASPTPADTSHRCPRCGRTMRSDFDEDVGMWYECDNCDYREARYRALPLRAHE